jgi:hypothetical protein
MIAKFYPYFKLKLHLLKLELAGEVFSLEFIDFGNKPSLVGLSVHLR